MKCLNCKQEIEQVGNRPKLYCSDKCRKAFLRKAHLSGQNTEKSYPDTDNPSYPDTPIPEFITDASGVQHKIDYEGRRRDYALLTSWAEGKGTPEQQTLGLLALDYDIIKQVNVQRYLGFTPALQPL